MSLQITLLQGRQADSDAMAFQTHPVQLVATDGVPRSSCADASCDERCHAAPHRATHGSMLRGEAHLSFFWELGNMKRNAPPANRGADSTASKLPAAKNRTTQELVCPQASAMKRITAVPVSTHASGGHRARSGCWRTEGSKDPPSGERSKRFLAALWFFSFLGALPAGRLSQGGAIYTMPTGTRTGTASAGIHTLLPPRTRKEDPQG